MNPHDVAVTGGRSEVRPPRLAPETFELRPAGFDLRKGEPPRLRIAIVGTGISGLVCGHLLRERHVLTLFEAGGHVGGHTNTVDVELDGQHVAVDTGFIVYNDRTYPDFIGLLGELGLSGRPTSMSFGVQCARTGVEYCGSNLTGLLAQRRNAWSPRFWRLVRDILRFNREGADGEVVPVGETVNEFLRRRRFSAAFAELYLLPMGAAIWSCPMTDFGRFPIRFILEFFRNHGLMQLRDRPVWRTLPGGARTYVERLIAPFRSAIRLATPVEGVRRTAAGVVVESAGGAETFDEVIFACHSDQALRLLRDPDPVELEVLRAFPYGRNTAVLHTDARCMPRRRAAWAAWNYHVPAGAEARPSVTYDMNVLQHLKTPRPLLVTLNRDDDIDPACVLRRFEYQHPVFTLERDAAQARHGELLRRRGRSYCGAYWGAGFHEDGVRSALAVCRAFGAAPAWRSGGSNAASRLERPAAAKGPGHDG